MLRTLPVLIAIAVTVYALIDCIRTPDAEVRTLPKWAWAVLILVLALLGAVAWLLFGRPRGGESGQGAARPRPRPRPVAPDDDPDFLRGIDEQRWLDERRRQRDSGEDPPPA